MSYAQLETKLGEIDRARAIYSHGSQFSDPRVRIMCMGGGLGQFPPAPGGPQTIDCLWAVCNRPRNFLLLSKIAIDGNNFKLQMIET